VGLDGGVPAALLLVEAAEQEVHLGVQFLVGVGLSLLAARAMALMNLTGRHGSTPSPGDGVTVVKSWNLLVNGP
jgi:hypothetical protein